MYGSRQQKKMMRFQKELDAQEAAKQQEQQRKADTLEAARREMLLAQNNAERARSSRLARSASLLGICVNTHSRPMPTLPYAPSCGVLSSPMNSRTPSE